MDEFIIRIDEDLDELHSSPSPRMRSLDATFSLGPLRSALCEGQSPSAGGSRSRLPSDSPELGYSSMVCMFNQDGFYESLGPICLITRV